VLTVDTQAVVVARRSARRRGHGVLDVVRRENRQARNARGVDRTSLRLGAADRLTGLRALGGKADGLRLRGTDLDRARARQVRRRDARARRARRDLADLARLHAAGQVDRDGLTDVRADLEGRRAERAVENLLAVERRLRADALDFRKTLLNFLVEGRAIRRAVARVRGLDRDLADALEVVRELAERALRRLGQRDTVARVADRLIQAVDLRREPVADREAGRVVLRAVDAQARRQTLQRGRKCRLRGRQIALRVDRQHVGVDNLSHGRCLLKWLKPDGPHWPSITGPSRRLAKALSSCTVLSDGPKRP